MSSPARLLILFVVLLGLLFAGGTLVWYLAYAVEQDPPEGVPIPTLNHKVTITWGPQGDASIEANHLEDAMTGLGYVHGHTRAWSIILWRQVALGRLGEWFGQPVLPLDRLTRQLGLADLGRSSFAPLDEQDRRLLRAYTDGLNAALEDPAIRLQQEFVLLDLDPEPWQPWHTLALERLFAWLAAPPPLPEDRPAADSMAGAFYAADQALRQWLHVHGFENSSAWVAQDSAGTHFFQRHVYGSTALPFFQEVSVQLQEGPSFQGASLPGTPFFPAGKTEQWTWALLLNGHARLEKRPAGLDASEVIYQRILSNDGTEHLTSFRRTDTHLPFLQAPSSSPDTVWAVVWNGLAEGSDCAAWHGLLRDVSLPFTLLEGNGLRTHQDGSWHILGTPPVVVRFSSGLFVGLTPWSRYAAEFLRSQLSGTVDLEAWIEDPYSIWAAQTAPPLINALSTPPPDAPPPLQDAVTYLRNWDYAYDRASIAASIFDQWVTQYYEAIGMLPDTTGLDTVATQPLLLDLLSRAVDTLSVAFGPDQSQWRWERLNPNRRFFPVWSSARALKAGSISLKADERFAPVVWPGRGHPSALAWGPSPIQRTLAAPAAWESQHHPDTRRFTVRRQRLDPRVPLGRYLTSDRSPDAITLPSSSATDPVTLLSPTP